MFGVAIAKLNEKLLVYKLTVENVQNCCAAMASSVISQIQDSCAVKHVISGKKKSASLIGLSLYCFNKSSPYEKYFT